MNFSKKTLMTVVVALGAIWLANNVSFINDLVKTRASGPIA